MIKTIKEQCRDVSLNLTNKELINEIKYLSAITHCMKKDKENYKELLAALELEAVRRMES